MGEAIKSRLSNRTCVFRHEGTTVRFNKNSKLYELLTGGFCFSLTSHAFESIRLALVVVAVILRFSLMPVYLQAYLNLAYDRIQEQKKEAGRITNIELQKKVIFFCPVPIVGQLSPKLGPNSLYLCK